MSHRGWVMFDDTTDPLALRYRDAWFADKIVDLRDRGERRLRIIQVNFDEDGFWQFEVEDAPEPE